MSSNQVIKRETDQSPARNIDPVDEQDKLPGIPGSGER